MKFRLAGMLFVVVSMGLGLALARGHVRSETAGPESKGAAVEPETTAPEDDRLVSRHKATPRMIEKAGAMDDQAAPTFRAEATDGQTYGLSEIARKDPMVLVFIKDHCPCSEAAQPFYNRLHVAYGSRVRFFGVFDGDRERAKSWAERHRSGFPLLVDPRREIIHAYRAENSAYCVIVAPGGRIEKYWPGYSFAMLEETGARLADLTGKPPRILDFNEAPDELYTGCPF